MYCGEFEVLENILAVSKFDQKKLFAKNKKRRKEKKKLSICIRFGNGYVLHPFE